MCRKSINRTGPGFGYGFMVAWAFVMSFFTLLSGLILEGFQSTVSTQLEDRECTAAGRKHRGDGVAIYVDMYAHAEAR